MIRVARKTRRGGWIILTVDCHAGYASSVVITSVLLCIVRYDVMYVQNVHGVDSDAICLELALHHVMTAIVPTNRVLEATTVKQLIQH